MPAIQAINGESLTPLLRGNGHLRSQALFWHYPHYSDLTTPYGAIRKGDHKLIEFFETGKLELFDLREDIGESKNLADRCRRGSRSSKDCSTTGAETCGRRCPR